MRHLALASNGSAENLARAATKHIVRYQYFSKPRYELFKPTYVVKKEKKKKKRRKGKEKEKEKEKVRRLNLQRTLINVHFVQYG